MDAKLIEELKAKHGVSELHLLTAGGESVLVKAPSRAEWLKWKSHCADERKRPTAGETLLRACCVHPDSQILDALLNRKPGLGDSFALEVIQLGGLVEEVERKVF